MCDDVVCLPAEGLCVCSNRCVCVGAFLPTFGSAIPLLDPDWFPAAHVRTSLRVSMYSDRGILGTLKTAGFLITRNSPDFLRLRKFILGSQNRGYFVSSIVDLEKNCAKATTCFLVPATPLSPAFPHAATTTNAQWRTMYFISTPLYIPYRSITITVQSCMDPRGVQY